MKTTDISLEDYLKAIVEKQSKCIAQSIARTALDEEEPILFLQNVLEYGCAFLALPDFVLYRDIHQFFDIHYKEIDILRDKYEISVPFKEDLKSYLAYFAFETVARELYDKWLEDSS